MSPLTLNEILRVTQGEPTDPALRSCRISGVTIDSRRVRTGDLFVAIKGQRHDGHDFVTSALAAGALYAMVSDTRKTTGTDVSNRLIRVPDTRQALCQIAAFYRQQLPTEIIAVTGSNGKTTTKFMIHHALSEHKRGRCGIKSYNNDIGVPLTLLSADSADDYLVVEVGSSGPGEIAQLAQSAGPDIAVLTSVGPAHLDGLKSIAGVAREKLSLLAHLKHRGLAVVNIDRPEVREQLSDATPYNLVTFGKHPEADLRVTHLRQHAHQLSFRINDRYAVQLPVLGRHNAENALAAFAVGRRFGLDPDELAQRLATFEIPDMRLQMHQYGSMIVINDCYNANPGSMRSAIETLQAMHTPGRRVAIIGDMLELGEQAERYHYELGRMIADSDVDVLLSVGSYAQVIADQAVRGTGGRLKTLVTADVESLAAALPHWLQPQDTILVKGSRALGLERLLATMAGH